MMGHNGLAPIYPMSAGTGYTTEVLNILIDTKGVLSTRVTASKPGALHGNFTL